MILKGNDLYLSIEENGLAIMKRNFTQLALPELEPYAEDVVSAVLTESAAAASAAANSNSRSLSVAAETEPVLAAVSPVADRASTDT